MSQLDRSKSVKEMWLQEQPTDNGWIASQITSYNARLGDFIVGGNRAPQLPDMDKWRIEILKARAKRAGEHDVHTENDSDFGCKACHIMGWEIDTSRPASELEALQGLASALERN